MSIDAIARMNDWRRAEADFDNWLISGVMSDGSAIRRHPQWGEGVFESQSEMVISPIAYSVRQKLRQRGILPLGDIHEIVDKPHGR